MKVAARIITALELDGPADLETLAERLDVSYATVYSAVRTLKAYGDILLADAPYTGNKGRPRKIVLLPAHAGLPAAEPRQSRGAVLRLEAAARRDARRADHLNRREAMLARYDAGLTLEQIAAEQTPPVTRERVRQIIAGPEYRAIKERRAAEVRDREMARRAPLVEKDCPTCGRTFAGYAARKFCGQFCYEISLSLRYVIDIDLHAKHQDQMADYYLAGGGTEANRRWAERLKADEATIRGRWFVKGSKVHVAANHAMVNGWPIFDQMHPDLQQWLRDHPINEPRP